MSATQDKKYATLRALHEKPGAFVIANAWNGGTARILTSMGFEALATTSAGYAFSVGRRDSTAGLNRDDVLRNAQEIMQATHLPVSADLEDGFGAAPQTCAQTIRQAASMGLVGGLIEDATGNPHNPIMDFDLSVARIKAAAAAAHDLPFMLTARAENFLYGREDLNDTIKRLQAFEAAGADVLYAPGLPDLDAIRNVCQALTKPFNIVMGLKGATYTVAELADAGVKRISVGGSFARAALGAFVRAAEEVKQHGTFTYATDAIPDADTAAYMAKTTRAD